MISDLAPLDLLLQRSGRLQRHSANNPRCHPNYLWITEPPQQDGVPKFDHSDKYVYEEYVLLRSWLVLKGQKQASIAIPVICRSLIEKVYGDQREELYSAALKEALADSWKGMAKEQQRAEDVAAERIINRPNYKRLLTEPNMSLGEEDDPELAPAFRALTRLGDPGVQVICLHLVNGMLHLEPDGSDVEIVVNAKPDKSAVLMLLRHSVAVRHPDPSVESALLEPEAGSLAAELLAQWKQVSALRFCRPVVFIGGAYRLPKTFYIIKLSRVLGLVVQKES